MQRIPLLGGSYTARSPLANAQRCINWMPERNPEGAPVPITHYQRPGLVPKCAPALPVPARGLYRASNGQGYAVIGSYVYYVTPQWTLKLLGGITPGRTNPVSMIDNGTTLMLVDGSTNGWEITLSNNAFGKVTDPTGIFTGADRVDTIDTYVLWNIPYTRQFGSTLAGSLTFDALFFASKVDYPDPLRAVVVNRHEILLMGDLKSEPWYDAGNPFFPFAELPGVYIEHGVASVYSIATTDISTFWLVQDLQGQGWVARYRGYECTRVSNHAVEYAIRQMVAAGATLTDVIGYTYQQDGHVYYALCFPSGNQTWVFDDSIGKPEAAWHQRAWTDGNGNLNRDRTNCCAYFNGAIVVGDWENGTLYTMDLNTYCDTVGGIQYPLTCIRGFPHWMAGMDSAMRAMVNDTGKELQVNRFMADIETGTAAADGPLGPLPGTGAPSLTLSVSRDRGRTFGSEQLKSAGETGQFETRPQWRQQGLGMDFVFELSLSYNGPAALNGAWIDAVVLNQ